MASLFGKTVARYSSESQRSFAGVPSSPSLSRSTCPANRLPNLVIILEPPSVVRSGRDLERPAGRDELHRPRGEADLLRAQDQPAAGLPVQLGLAGALVRPHQGGERL